MVQIQDRGFGDMGGDSVRLRQLGTGGREGTDDEMKKGHEHTGEASEERHSRLTAFVLWNLQRGVWEGYGRAGLGLSPGWTLLVGKGDAGAGISGFQSRYIWLAV